MPKSIFVDFKAVKAAVTMEQVLGRYGLLDKFKRSGDSLSGPCPIHKGSNPTQFRVSTAKNVFNCFSECKHGGNVLDFIAKMEDTSVHAAALKAIEWFNLDPASFERDSDETESDEPAEKPARKAELQQKAKPAPASAPEDTTPNKPLKFKLEKLDTNHPYLVERDLTPDTIAHFEIGFCAKGMMADRIAIPIRNQAGFLLAYAGRFLGDPPDGEAKYKLPPGFKKSLELFHLHQAIQEPPEAPLVIVEGFFDCMKLFQHGCRKVVALMGSTMSQAQEERLKSHQDKFRRIIVMLDEDEAGIAGRDDIAARLAKFAFVRVKTFEVANMQPENLSPEDVQQIMEECQ